MKGDGGVKIPFGGAHFQGDRHDLDDLGGMVAEDMAAQNLVGIGVHDQLHIRAHGPPAQGVQQRLEGGFVDIDPMAFAQGAGLGQADTGQLGRGKDRAGDMPS